MSDDTAITDRLRKLGEELADDRATETIVLDDSAIMETAELKRLLDPDQPVERPDPDDEKST